MAQHVTILLISDDSEIQQVLDQALSTHGFRLQEARKGRQDLVEALSVDPDLILVDLTPPDSDGIEVIRQIRDQTHTPIIVLCRRDDERTTVAALDCGADDYVTKPVHAPGLVVHLRAALATGPAVVPAVTVSPRHSADAFGSTFSGSRDEAELEPTDRLDGEEISFVLSHDRRPN